MIEKLLEIRKELKERKPEFIRQDTHKRKKLTVKWRKPKGIHSKIRHHFKGRGKMPSPGYKSPAKVRGMHSSGLKMINISSIKDLQKIKNQSEGVVISKTVGMKKKIEILKMAKELKIKVLNLNLDEHIGKIESFLSSKKKEVKEEKKEAKKDAKESKDQKGAEHEPSDAERKDLEKKERDKVLTKRI